MKRVNILSKLKSQVKLIESIITEGDHWPEDYRRKAINRIKLATAGKTPVYNENDIESDVDKLIAKFEPLSHKNSNVGYFLPIIRMFIGYTGNDKAKRNEFVDNKMDMLVKTLGLISSDPSLETKFKDDIKQKWTLEDFEKHAAELQAEIDKADADSLASVGDSSESDYDIIIINSYEELHEKFGGDKTGYKGKSEWCHTNGKSTYDGWTRGGIHQFFVLAKKGWEKIKPPDPKTTNAFDEYGTSLIAILVKVDDCELLNATLRWNHVIEPGETVPKTSVDKAFLGWGDLSKTVGFNVKVIVEKDTKQLRDKFIAKTKKIMTSVTKKLKNITEITRSTFTVTEKRFIKHVDIPNNITNIGDEAFYECSNLTSVTIPDSVTSIGNSAFCTCASLKSITIPDSVTSIGSSAFAGCRFTSITIPDRVTYIGQYAFAGCRFTSITIPKGVPNIGNGTFFKCRDLTGLTIPDSVTSIGNYAFGNCDSLTSVTIPDNVKSIGYLAFDTCDSLTSVTIGNSVTSIGTEAFSSCDRLTDVVFKGKSLDEVSSMENYPWRINDPEKVIRVTDASN